MMKRPEWCRECPFYFKGMSENDYLYIQYLIRNGKQDVVLKIQKGEVELPDLSERTKEDVFKIFNGDINYKFDIETMC